MRVRSQVCKLDLKYIATVVSRSLSCRRAPLAKPGLHPRWRVGECALVLLLLLAPLAGSAAPQNPPPASPTAYNPAIKITDLGFFVDLKDENKWLYLPRYRIAVQTVSGDPQYRVRLAKQGPGWDLEAFLEKHPASGLRDELRKAYGENPPKALEEHIRAARELPHQTEVLLRYDLPTNAGGNQANAYKELVFQEVTLERSGLKAVLHLEDLRERDALIHALEDPKLDATLLVQRTFTVLSIPWEEREACYAGVRELDKEIESLRVEAINCGYPSLPAFYEEMRKGKEDPNEVCSRVSARVRPRRAELDGQRALLFAKWLELSKRVPVTADLDNVVQQPFSFDRTLHPYVFAGIIPDPGAKPQLVRSQLSWQDRYYSYFRPADRTDLWYFLPDRFVLAEEKQVPQLSVQFTGPPEAQTVELEYVAVPWTDPARLEAAKAALRPTANSSVTIEPLLVDEAQLWLARPGVGNDGAYQRRLGASVDLRDGLKDQVPLTLEEFQKIYAALFSSSHTLLTGEVRLDLGGSTRERIPFEARVTGQSPEALWDEILSQVVFADYQKTIRVKTPGTVFGKEVKTLVVEFKEGDTVELRQDQLEALTKVRLPLREFILNTEDNGLYHYKVTTIRERDGKFDQTKMPSWKAATATILYPEVP
ncbi:MAG: hypothetical protein L0387_28870 [Acidobacteria bacterium]|nr:hypothetical protein [Acidobacteriota bacterium]